MSKANGSDWINAGLSALATGGIGALKAEPVARALGVSKGSFYWHFQDVNAYHSAVLESWEHAEAAAITLSAFMDGTAENGLRAIVARFVGSEMYDSVCIEVAIRHWARQSEAAKRSVRRVDHQRLRLLQDSLARMGLTNPNIAETLYSCIIGAQSLRVTDDVPRDHVLQTQIDMMIALAQSD
ncbi:MAG: TetR/AcrR family transcriptional regulator [Pseudomonadota bacterium]